MCTTKKALLVVAYGYTYNLFTVGIYGYGYFENACVYFTLYCSW